MGETSKKPKPQAYQAFSLRYYEGVFYKWCVPRGTDWTDPNNIPCEDIENFKWHPLAQRVKHLSEKGKALFLEKARAGIAQAGHLVFGRRGKLEDLMNPQYARAWSTLIEPLLRDQDLFNTKCRPGQNLTNSMVSTEEGGDVKCEIWLILQRESQSSYQLLHHTLIEEC